jgi:flagellar secretion chaperone FliS
MTNSARDAYLASTILAADPIELVQILYSAALESVREAREHLAAGEITGRSKAISRAVGALSELNASLDHEQGGEVSRRLAGLYDYMQRRLLEANFQQADGPLAEVLGLLATLSETWQKVSRDAPAEERSAAPFSDLYSEAGPEYAARSWSA